jgi:molybdenum cofactor cytidylyltransferase
MTLCGVLLAAGASRRFGGPKLLARLPGGEAVAERAARSLRDGVTRALAVVRPGDVELERMMSGLGLQVVACPRSQRGLGASLACGVAASADADGWIVALADMPGVAPATVSGLAAALADGAAVVAPCYNGRRGHPVGFGRVHRDALLALDGDRGGRDIVAAAGGSLRLLPVDDRGVLWDIDLPGHIAAGRAAAAETRS